MTELPEAWEWHSLADVTIRVAKVDPKALGRTEFRYVDIGSVDGSRHALGETANTLTDDAPGRARQLLAGGDTVFSTVRPYLEKIAYIGPGLDGEIASTGFCVLRPGAHVDRRYLFHFATSRALLDQVLPLQRGVSYPAVRDRDVLLARIPVPPIGEQRRIVDILEDHLSRLDAAAMLLRVSRRRADAFASATLERVTSSAERWGILGDLIERVEAGRSVGRAAAPAVAGEWGIIKVSAMTWGEFRPGENKAIQAGLVDTRFEIRPGDVLLSRANTSEYVGASVYVESTPPRLLLSDKSLRLVPVAGVDSHWLQLTLASPSAREQMTARATGTKDSMRNLSQQRLLDIRVPLASVDHQQSAVREYSSAREAAIRLRSALANADRRSQALRRALLAAAFSGKLTGATSDIDRIEEMAS